MTSFNNRILDMLLRVLVFTQSFPQYFLEGSIARRLIDRLDAAAKKMLEYRKAQHSGKGDSKVSTAERAAAHDTLLSQLNLLSRNAKALNFSQFWLSRDETDKSLVNQAETFIERAEPLKQSFIDRHMAPDFIDQLSAARQNLWKAMSNQTFTQHSRTSATEAISEALDEAMAALAELDPVVENLLQNDRPALAVWQSARHVARYTGSRRAKPDEATEDPSPPPVSDNGAAAAQA